jgi:hypothetical protein
MNSLKIACPFRCPKFQNSETFLECHCNRRLKVSFQGCHIFSRPTAACNCCNGLAGYCFLLLGQSLQALSPSPAGAQAWPGRTQSYCDLKSKSEMRISLLVVTISEEDLVKNSAQLLGDDTSTFVWVFWQLPLIHCGQPPRALPLVGGA